MAGLEAFLDAIPEWKEPCFKGVFDYSVRFINKPDIITVIFWGFFW